MSVIIRTADLERDKATLISTLSQYLTPTSNESRYQWLYLNNPLGPARAWLATDGKTGQPIGSSAAFPRQICVNGEVKVGWVLGDFCISASHRSLGPALQLQRATITALADSQDFYYDFPSRQLTAIYRRLGIQTYGQLVRMVKLLRLNRKLQKVRGLRGLSGPASSIGNLLLRTFDYSLGGHGGWDIAIHEGDCAEEFTALAMQNRGKNQIEIMRSAEYLNWRYLQHPFFQYRILTARKAGRLEGYLVFTLGNEDAQVVEWCVGNHDRLLVALVQDLIRRLRKVPVATVSSYLLQTDRRVPLLTKMGFWQRECCPVMMHWPDSMGEASHEWSLMYGDRDS